LARKWQIKMKTTNRSCSPKLTEEAGEEGGELLGGWRGSFVLDRISNMAAH
jgi:hypothetical protein